MHKSFRLISQALAAAFLLAASAGCIPNASWLPDSSGFVYTGGPGAGQLIYYDIATGKSRAVLKGTVYAPSVSPDGKRLAVVQFSRNDQNSVEAVVYDLDGKELQRSKPLERPAESAGRPRAFWIPGQDRLLLDDRFMGFYDLKTGKCSMNTTLRSTVSITGGSPIRPDGKGFVARKTVGKENMADGCVFVDWDGKETPIEVKTKVFPLDKDDAAPGGNANEKLTYWPAPLRWDGNTAVIRASDIRITIDTDKLTARQDVVTPELNADKKWVHDQFRLAGGVVVRTVEMSLAHQKDRAPGEAKPLLRIEVQKPGEKEATTIMEDAEFALIDPSPDGKMALVQGWNLDNGDKGWLFLIDAKGDVAAKIDAFKTP